MCFSCGQLQLISLSHCESITDDIVIALGYVVSFGQLASVPVAVSQMLMHQ
jgi:hypothetical protein